MAADWLDWGQRAALALTLAIAVVWTLRPLLRRFAGPSAALWSWWVLPAALLAASLPARVELRELPATAFVAMALPTTSAAPGVAALPVPGASLEALLVAAWLAGGLATAAVFAWQQRRFRRRLGRLAPMGEGVYRAATRDIGPVLVGLWRPRIVVPLDFECRYDADQRALVLAHERQHLRRGDLVANFAACALRTLFWFHPLVHLAAAQLRWDQELACDAAVLRRHPHAGRAYATALLNSQLAVPGLPVGCAWQSSHPLARRITMLRNPLPGWPRLVLGAGFALLASTATATALWQSRAPDIVWMPAIAAAGAIEAPRPALAVATAPIPSPRPALVAPVVAAAAAAPSASVSPVVAPSAPPTPAAAPVPAVAPVAPVPAVAATPAVATVAPVAPVAATPSVAPVAPAAAGQPASSVAPAAPLRRGDAAPAAAPAAPARAGDAAPATAPVATPRPQPTRVSGALVAPTRFEPVPATLPAPREPRAPVEPAPAPSAIVMDVDADPGYEAPRVLRYKAARLPRSVHVPGVVRVEGVVVRVELDARGEPVDVAVEHNPLGALYGRNAIAAVKRWDFEPARRDGQAVPATVLVPVWFEPMDTSAELAQGEALSHPLPRFPPPPQPIAGM